MPVPPGTTVASVISKRSIAFSGSKKSKLLSSPTACSSSMATREGGGMLLDEEDLFQEGEKAELVPSEVISAEDVYSHFGGITKNNAEHALRLLGILDVPQPLLDDFFGVLPPKTTYLSRAEFFDLLVLCKQHFLDLAAENKRDEAEHGPGDHEAVTAFAAIGGGGDRSGFIEQEQLKDLCINFGLGIDIDEFMEEVDEDGNGTVEYCEFMKLLLHDGAGVDVVNAFQAIGGQSQEPGAPMVMDMQVFLQLVRVPTPVLIAIAAEGDSLMSLATFCDVLKEWKKEPVELVEMADRERARLQAIREEEEDYLLYGHQGGSAAVSPGATPSVAALSLSSEPATASSPDRYYALRMNRRVDRVIEAKRNYTKSRRNKPEAREMRRLPVSALKPHRVQSYLPGSYQRMTESQLRKREAMEEVLDDLYMSQQEQEQQLPKSQPQRPSSRQRSPFGGTPSPYEYGRPLQPRVYSRSADKMVIDLRTKPTPTPTAGPTTTSSLHQQSGAPHSTTPTPHPPIPSAKTPSNLHHLAHWITPQSQRYNRDGAGVTYSPVHMAPFTPPYQQDRSESVLSHRQHTASSEGHPAPSAGGGGAFFSQVRRAMAARRIQLVFGRWHKSAARRLRTNTTTIQHFIKCFHSSRLVRNLQVFQNVLLLQRCGRGRRSRLECYEKFEFGVQMESLEAFVARETTFSLAPPSSNRDSLPTQRRTSAGVFVQSTEDPSYVAGLSSEAEGGSVSDSGASTQSLSPRRSYSFSDATSEQSTTQIILTRRSSKSANRRQSRSAILPPQSLSLSPSPPRRPYISTQPREEESLPTSRFQEEEAIDGVQGGGEEKVSTEEKKEAERYTLFPVEGGGNEAADDDDERPTPSPRRLTSPPISAGELSPPRSGGEHESKGAKKPPLEKRKPSREEQQPPQRAQQRHLPAKRSSSLRSRQDSDTSEVGWSFRSTVPLPLTSPTKKEGEDSATTLGTEKDRHDERISEEEGQQQQQKQQQKESSTKDIELEYPIEPSSAYPRPTVEAPSVREGAAGVMTPLAQQQQSLSSLPAGKKSPSPRRKKKKQRPDAPSPSGSVSAASLLFPHHRRSLDSESSSISSAASIAALSDATTGSLFGGQEPKRWPTNMATCGTQTDEASPSSIGSGSGDRTEGSRSPSLSCAGSTGGISLSDAPSHAPVVAPGEFPAAVTVTIRRFESLLLRGSESCYVTVKSSSDLDCPIYTSPEGQIDDEFWKKGDAEFQLTLSRPVVFDNKKREVSHRWESLHFDVFSAEGNEKIGCATVSQELIIRRIQAAGEYETQDSSTGVTKKDLQIPLWPSGDSSLSSAENLGGTGSTGSDLRERSSLAVGSAVGHLGALGYILLELQVPLCESRHTVDSSKGPAKDRPLALLDTLSEEGGESHVTALTPTEQCLSGGSEADESEVRATLSESGSVFTGQRRKSASMEEETSTTLMRPPLPRPPKPKPPKSTQGMHTPSTTPPTSVSDGESQAAEDEERAPAPQTESFGGNDREREGLSLDGKERQEEVEAKADEKEYIHYKTVLEALFNAYSVAVHQPKKKREIMVFQLLQREGRGVPLAFQRHITSELWQQFLMEVQEEEPFHASARSIEVRDALDSDRPEDAAFVETSSLLLQSKGDYVNDGEGEKHPESFSQFCKYLLDVERNSYFDPSHRTVFQPMNHPLHHYYINTSHNTYLTGDQFMSESSVEMYRQVLRSGCRCVEIDCWDGPDGEPIVYHGYTRTSKIKFVEVVEGIRECAFEASPYPVILSLEVHTCKAQSTKMAEYMSLIFGESLLTFPELLEGGQEKWSPEALQYRIIAKYKRNPKKVDVDVKEEGGEIEVVTPTPGSGTVMTPSPSSCTSATESPSETMATTVRSTDSIPTVPGTPPEGSLHYSRRQHSQQQFSLTLESLVVVNGVKTKKWGTDSHCTDITSLAESKAEKQYNKDGENLRQQSTRMLIKVYPAGWRIGSSNYDPNSHWEVGAQVVALNFQSWDDAIRHNTFKFLSNGRSGYLLKPDYLRNPFLPRPQEVQRHLRITVLMGHRLRKLEPKVNPYLNFKLVGARTDMVRNPSKKTKCAKFEESPASKLIGADVAAENQLGLAVWNETFDFQLLEPQLACLRVKLLHSSFFSDDSLAEVVLNVTDLRPGLRSIPLYSLKSPERLEDVALLFHIHFLEPQPQPSAPNAVEDQKEIEERFNIWLQEEWTAKLDKASQQRLARRSPVVSRPESAELLPEPADEETKPEADTDLSRNTEGEVVLIAHLQKPSDGVDVHQQHQHLPLSAPPLSLHPKGGGPTLGGSFDIDVSPMSSLSHSNRTTEAPSPSSITAASAAGLEEPKKVEADTKVEAPIEVEVSGEDVTLASDLKILSWAPVPHKAGVTPEPLLEEPALTESVHSTQETPSYPVTPSGGTSRNSSSGRLLQPPLTASQAALIIQKWVRGSSGRDTATDRWDALMALETYRLVEEGYSGV